MSSPRPEALTLSITEAASLMGVSRDLAYDLVRTGEFPVPVLRIGRRYRVPKARLEAYLQSQREPPAVIVEEAPESPLQRLTGKLSRLNDRQLLVVESVVDEMGAQTSGDAGT